MFLVSSLTFKMFYNCQREFKKKISPQLLPSIIFPPSDLFRFTLLSNLILPDLPHRVQLSGAPPSWHFSCLPRWILLQECFICPLLLWPALLETGSEVGIHFIFLYIVCVRISYGALISVLLKTFHG